MKVEVILIGGDVDVSAVDSLVIVNFSSIEVTVDIGIGADIILPSLIPFSSQPFYSFDLQQTLIAPLNKSAPEFNTTRF